LLIAAAAPATEEGQLVLFFLPHLVWIGIQVVRPLVIASAFALYRDAIREEERLRGAQQWRRWRPYSGRLG
jgi:hypothetical protein